MAAMIFSSAILTIFLALSNAILPRKHHDLPAKYGGTSFQLPFRTAAALMFLNLDFIQEFFFLFEHLTSFKL